MRLRGRSEDKVMRERVGKGTLKGSTPFGRAGDIVLWAPGPSLRNPRAT